MSIKALNSYVWNVSDASVTSGYEKALEDCRARGIVPGSIIVFDQFMESKRVGASMSLLIRGRGRNGLLKEKSALVLAIVMPIIPREPELKDNMLYSATQSQLLFSTDAAAVIIVLRLGKIVAVPLAKFVAENSLRTDVNFNGIKVIARG